MKRRVKTAYSGGLFLPNLYFRQTFFKQFCIYRGAGPGCNTQEIGEKLAQLRNEVASLDALEKHLDQHKQVIELISR